MVHTYRVVGDEYRPYEPTTDEQSEEELETELEKNPHVLLAPDQLLYIGRQVHTSDDTGRALDLFGVDANRRLVFIELKKIRMPRDIVAQALEYAAHFSQLPFEQIDLLARKYFDDVANPTQANRGKDLREAHESYFAGVLPPVPTAEWGLSTSPTIIVQGQRSSDTVAETATFLRRYNIDIRVLRFNWERDAAGERLVRVEVIAGPEPSDETAETFEHRINGMEIARVLRSLLDAASTLGLERRTINESVSFDAPRGTFITVYPAKNGKRAYFHAYSQAVGRQAISDFEREILALGFERRRGSDLSVWVRPIDEANIVALVDAYRRTCLASAP